MKVCLRCGHEEECHKPTKTPEEVKRYGFQTYKCTGDKKGMPCKDFLPSPVEDQKEDNDDLEPAVDPIPDRKHAVDYSKLRQGRNRATNEEGIGEELKTMSAEAGGSPFFGRKEKEKRDRNTSLDKLNRALAASSESSDSRQKRS